MKVVNLIRELNKFWELAEERKLCGHDQLLYLRLLHEFNAARFPEELEFTDAELLKRLDLHDGQGAPVKTLRNMKARLKKKEFVEFERGKRGTVYRLKPLSGGESEVVRIWRENGGIAPTKAIAEEMEKRASEVGLEQMAEDIRQARAANRYPRMSYVFFENYIERRSRGETGSDTEQYAGLEDDEPEW